jgi:porin
MRTSLVTRSSDSPCNQTNGRLRFRPLRLHCGIRYEPGRLFGVTKRMGQPMEVRLLHTITQVISVCLLLTHSICADEFRKTAFNQPAERDDASQTDASFNRSVTTAVRLAFRSGQLADTTPESERPLLSEDEQVELLPEGGRGGKAAEEGAAKDEEEEEEEEEEAAPELETLLDDQWHRLGCVAAEYCYTGEIFNNTRGGISTKGATRYRGNLDLGLRLDTEAAHWWDDGEIYVYMQQSQGETLTADFVGDGQFYSNIDTSPKPATLTQLGEYWYQHKFGEDLLTVRVGRQTPNDDFAFADTGLEFVNSSFWTLPNIPMPYWPFQTLGVTSIYRPHETWRLGGGVYDQGRDVGQWWVTTASRGMFFLGQADYMPFADCDDAPLTIFRGGAWFSSSDTEAVNATRTFDGNYGFYTTIDRSILREVGAPEQGLAAFFQFCWAPGDRNQVEQGVGAGLVYTGLLEGRDADTCGGGFSLIQFSPDVRAVTGQTSENAIEVFYKAQLCDWLAIKPDLQYIARPSGIYNDAMVVGIRFEMIL